MNIGSPRKGSELIPRVFAIWQEQVISAIRNLGFVRAVSIQTTHNFPSVAAHGQQATTIALVGAREGGACLVSLGSTAFISGLIFDGKVSTDDEVRLRVSNYSDAAIDPGNKAFSIVVFNL